MPDSPPIVLVPHTHWDREWYRPFQAFRIQLVDLIDRVLDELDADPEFRFTLDGQLVTVDDYLEIRPEARERIASHVATGRLAIGPWLVLMDEFLVSGETIVRNLEAGTARAEELGGAMPIGYLPDMFGHVAQVPQLLRRAGLEQAVVWRGVPSEITSHAFTWRAPDGSTVRAEYLPAGYGNAADLFDAPDSLADAVDRLRAAMDPWFGSEPILAMYGTDHAVPDASVGPLLRRMRELGVDAGMATLAEYVAAVRPAHERQTPWDGEMRSGARANVLMGVTSAHIDIKRAAGRAERLLERYAEPLHALHAHPAEWPEAFLRVAWRRVIECSAHDSICGCSADAVTQQVLARLAEAEQIAGTLVGRLASAMAARVRRPGGAIVNPSPLRRSGVVELDVGVPDEWDAVELELPDGTRLPTQEISRKESELLAATYLGRDVDDLLRLFHGREVLDHQWNGYRISADPAGGPALDLLVDVDPDPAELDVGAMRHEVIRAMRAQPDAAWSVRLLAAPRRRIAASVPAPALGWMAVRAVQVAATTGSMLVENAVRVAGEGLENGRLRIEPAADGTLILTAADGTRAEGAVRLVDGGDYGDTYNYAPPADDTVVDEPERVHWKRLEAGPIRGRLRVERTYRWPAGLGPGGRGRSAETAETSVLTEVELRADEPFARVSISFDNGCDDHRVRAHLPLPRAATTSDAEGQFAVVRRGTRAEGGYRETPVPTFPARGWVDAGGLAVLLDHVSEYELVALRGDAAGELALTVLRAVGLISRSENPYRQDPAGPQLAVPAAQMRGPWSFTFGLLPHSGDWRAADVPAAAERYANELLAATSHAADGTWPPAGAGHDALVLEGREVVISEVRRRDRDWLELRIVNLAPEPRAVVVQGAWLAAREADLLGRPGADLPLEDGPTLRLELGPAEIRTVQVRRGETGELPSGIDGSDRSRLGD